MDKTIINLLTILICGAGILAVITKYSVPELNATFWGANPFAIKRDIIKNTMTLMFTFMAVFGLFIQAYGEIMGDKFPSRIYSIKFYSWFFIIGLICTVLIILSLSFVGNKVAKIKWTPIIVESQREIFDSATFIIKNNGLSKDELKIIDKLENSARKYPAQYKQKKYKQINKYKEINYKDATESISQIEKLLEINNEQDELDLRLQRLDDYFKK